MYRGLLCWRYLRTRWIALASVVSVTLGVATLIVVNSVMDGFTSEMHNRIHGILSDVVIECHSSMGVPYTAQLDRRIREVVGDDLEGLTTIVAVPAVLSYQFYGANNTRHISLIGIDTSTYASVSDFSQYLLHPENRKQLDFLLRQSGYAPERADFPFSGWDYRQPMQAEKQRQWRIGQRLEEQRAASERMRRLIEADESEAAELASDTRSGSATVPPPPLSSPPTFSMAGPSMVAAPSPDEGEASFNPELHQHTGIVLGIGMAMVRDRNSDGEVRDFYLLRPGDDVDITLAGAGMPPRPINERFTVVDFYESRMSEYDGMFAFMPLDKLQEFRQMLDPSTGQRSVTSIQMKLRPGGDLAGVRDRLRATFPAETMFVIETWRDKQGPLLQAVQLETMILNILLFLIIAVAGFGILATFFMIVVEKTRDIGVLKSLGASGGGVASIFLAYGLLLGGVGSGAGAVAGLLFVWNINTIAKWLEWLSGREVFDPTIYYFDTIPAIVHPSMVVWVVVGSMIIAVLASVLPSIRAARMHPVEALRYE